MLAGRMPIYDCSTSRGYAIEVAVAEGGRIAQHMIGGGRPGRILGDGANIWMGDRHCARRRRTVEIRSARGHDRSITGHHYWVRLRSLSREELLVSRSISEDSAAGLFRSSRSHGIAPASEVGGSRSLRSLRPCAILMFSIFLKGAR